jgi:hypothetical protein
MVMEVGQVFRSRGGSEYKVSEVRASGRGAGFSAVRLSSGKEVRCSRRLIDRTRSALLAGKALKVQSNGPGGISYTVAVEAAVLFALRSEGIAVRLEGRTWVV